MIITFIFAAVLLSVVMTGAWVLQRMTGNCGWVDVVWSFGLGLAGLVLALVPNGPTTRQIVVAALIAAWSVRLACTSRSARPVVPRMPVTPRFVRSGVLGSKFASSSSCRSRPLPPRCLVFR